MLSWGFQFILRPSCSIVDAQRCLEAGPDHGLWVPCLCTMCFVWEPSGPDREVRRAIVSSRAPLCGPLAIASAPLPIRIVYFRKAKGGGINCKSIRTLPREKGAAHTRALPRRKSRPREQRRTTIHHGTRRTRSGYRIGGLIGGAGAGARMAVGS